MIPRDAITEWRRMAPWPTDAQVEQDLVLSRALVEIFENPLLNRALAFRGGTALHKLFLPRAARYSEDIDLVQVEGGPIGAVMTALRDILDPWLGAARRSQGEGRMTFLYRFESELPPVIPLRLKVEVNTREHFCVLGHVTKAFRVKSQWFEGSAGILSFAMEELMATKLRALYQRRKGRDLFDLAIALKHGPINAGVLVECFEEYMSRSGLSVSRAQFEANLKRKLGEAEFAADLPLILSSEALEEFDRQLAAERVLRELVSRLKGEAWQGEG